MCLQLSYQPVNTGPHGKIGFSEFCTLVPGIPSIAPILEVDPIWLLSVTSAMGIVSVYLEMPYS